jgi:hypothetical protein
MFALLHGTNVSLVRVSVFFFEEEEEDEDIGIPTSPAPA